MSLQLAVETLIVDDSPVDRKLAASLLEKHSHLTVGAVPDGKSALALIAQKRPDVVVADMVMPEMDGLELVKTLRRLYPQLPVILMTAHGSEENALDALRAGAAGYVPKHTLARDLVPTVERVMELCRQHTGKEELIDRCAQYDAIYILGPSQTMLEQLVDDTRKKLLRMRLCDPVEAVQVATALEAALKNALYHGNLEIPDLQAEGAEKLLSERCVEKPYCQRKVRVRVKLSHEEVRLIVRDEGPGFRPPDQTQAAERSMSGEAGRGLVLARSFMDEVTFNEQGNMITLVRSLKRTGERAVAEPQNA